MSDELRSSGLVLVRPAERFTDPQGQTSGMRREGGVTPETCGSRGLWAGHVTTPPGAVSGRHHHGDAESAIYMLSGRARFRWGPGLAHEAVAEAGDFVYVPPGVVHAEENLSATEPVVFIVARNAASLLTVNVEDAPQG